MMGENEFQSQERSFFLIGSKGGGRRDLTSSPRFMRHDP
jgi:hypothetical protein